MINIFIHYSLNAKYMYLEWSKCQIYVFRDHKFNFQNLHIKSLICKSLKFYFYKNLRI